MKGGVVLVFKKPKFLVVFEDLYNNRESITTTKIGDAIKTFVDGNALICDSLIDYKRYNSRFPYDTGTLSLGFCDIDFTDEDGEYSGRIIIFQI